MYSFQWNGGGGSVCPVQGNRIDAYIYLFPRVAGLSTLVAEADVPEVTRFEEDIIWKIIQYRRDIPPASCGLNALVPT